MPNPTAKMAASRIFCIFFETFIFKTNTLFPDQVKSDK